MTNPPPIPAEILELLEEFAYAVEVNGYAIKHNSRTALLSAIARAIAGGRGEPVACIWQEKVYFRDEPMFHYAMDRTGIPLYAPPAPEKVDG